MVVLQRAGNDFRGRCRAAINHDNHRMAARHVAAPRGETRTVAPLTPACRHNLATVEHGVGNRHGLGQKPARIIPQIDDKARQLFVADFGRQGGKCFFQIFGRLRIKCCQANIADIFARPLNPMAHGTDADNVPRDGYFQRFVLTFAQHGEGNVRALLPAHALHRLS